MKLRSFFSGLVAVVLVLLVIGASGFFWLFSNSPLSLLKGETVSPTAAMFVSKQAPAMVSLLVNPDRLQALRQVVARPENRRRARAELDQLKQSLLANTGLSYQRDIQPWLGQEITAAVTTLDLDRDTDNGRQAGYLLAVATKDPERSREFLQLFWQKRALAGADLVFEQYKGVKLIYGSGKAVTEVGKDATRLTSSLASAVVGDRFVLFANHPKVLRDAINNVQAPDLNLSSATFYEQALGTLEQPRIGLSFVNVPRLTSWAAGVRDRPADAQPATAPPPAQLLTIALTLDQRGLAAETALLSPNDPPETVSPPLSKPVGALQYVPDFSPISASGSDLNQLWTGLSQQLKGYGAVAQLVDQSLAELQDRWKLDLRDDVFDWVTGEYALGLLPVASAQSSAKSVPAPADWVFVAQRSDPAASEGIARLDAIAQQQGLSVGSIQLGAQTVAAWTRLSTAAKPSSNPLALQAQVQGVHATVGNYELFTTSLAAMDQALKAMEHSLATNDRFQAAIDPLLQPNDGYLYLDWIASQPFLERQFPLLKVIKLAGKPIVDHIKSLAITSYGRQSGVQRGGVFIRLGGLGD